MNQLILNTKIHAFDSCAAFAQAFELGSAVPGLRGELHRRAGTRGGVRAFAEGYPVYQTVQL